MKKDQHNFLMSVNNGELNIKVERKIVKKQDIKQNFKEEFKLIEKLEN